MQQRASDSTTSQMKRAQAAAELAQLHFDEADYNASRSRLERAVEKTKVEWAEAKSAYEAEVTETDCRAIAECESQLQQ